MLDVEDHAEAFAKLHSADSHDNSDVLVIPGWAKSEWSMLFSYATQLTLSSGTTLIRQQEADRTLYFLVSGMLEAAITSGEHAMASLRRMYPGSVVGELAFFDGKPRLAQVWAVTDSRLLRLEFADYTRFAAAEARRANEFLFALARLVAVRLRHATVRRQRRIAGPA